MKTLLIAHRGDTNNFPENTIKSFQSAFEKGADGIELDIQYFHKKFIVVHDYLFDKNKPYPLLSDVMDKFISKGRIEIEVKAMDVEFIENLKKIIIQHDSSNIEITSSIFPIFSYLRQVLPKIYMRAIFHPFYFEDWMTEEFINQKIVKYCSLMKVNIVHLPWLIINQKLVKNCHQNNLKVHSHICREDMKNQVKNYEQMQKIEVDQCTFDDINLLKYLKI
jgi:glycerophosphoryl diester phosphodiesterase